MPQIVQSETVDKNISAVEQGASFGTVDLVTKLDVKKNILARRLTFPYAQSEFEIS